MACRGLSRILTLFVTQCRSPQCATPDSPPGLYLSASAVSENSSCHPTQPRRQHWSQPPRHLLDLFAILCPRSFFAASPFLWTGPPVSLWTPRSNQTGLPLPGFRPSPQSLPLAPRAPCSAIRLLALPALFPAY